MKTFSVLFISCCLFTNGANAQTLLITKLIWDEKNGGWRWKAKEDGSQVDNGKIVYGHCRGSEYDGGRYCCTSICH
jgi:hypothetical protein